MNTNFRVFECVHSSKNIMQSVIAENDEIIKNNINELAKNATKLNEKMQEIETNLRIAQDIFLNAGRVFSQDDMDLMVNDNVD